MGANDDEGATRQTVLPESGSPDDQPTGHVTTKLAAATKEKICDRFIMSLPFGDRDISGYRGVAMLQK